MRNDLSAIHIFREKVEVRLHNKQKLLPVLHRIAKRAGFTIVNLNYIFCNDRYLRKMNVEYLQHDYNTDIITFDNSTARGKIEADIFISIDTVRKNAGAYNVSFQDELNRVMIHGLLHLTGMDDKNPELKSEMRAAEDRWLKELKKS